jgi:DeoR/GlpR family transcriptional regulator of sugar metabolism
MASVTAPARRQSILEIVRSGGPATTTELVERLGHSEATIRRDLVKLDELGLLRRVHGGARPIEQHDDPFADIVDVAGGAKDVIARTAAAGLVDGQSVLLDIGTTVARVAKHLHGRDLTVITRNLAAYEELCGDDSLELVLLGGVVRPHHRDLIGYLTESNLRQVRADVVLLGTAGLRRTGHLVDTQHSEVSVKQAAIAAGDRVVVLADSTKFPGSGTATVCDATALSSVITEREPDAETAAALAAGGCAVHVTG